jgi:hypothetical protein
MKKLLLLLAISAFLSAQISQGTIQTGGAISFTSQSVDGQDDALSTLTVNPVFGYFFNENFSAGVIVNLLRQSLGDQTNSVYGFGPELRYYFGSDKMIPFLNAAFLLNSMSISGSNGDISFKTIRFGAGLDYFLTDAVAIEPAITFSMNSGDDIVKNSIFGVAVGFSIFLK